MKMKVLSGTIRRPINKYQGAALWDAVEFDTRDLRSVFGDSLRSLHEIEASFNEFSLTKLESVHVENERNLVFVCRLFGKFETNEELASYADELLRIWHGERFLRGFREGVFDAHPGRTDFWWDLQNNVFWSFDRRFMSRLPEHLKASFSPHFAQQSTTSVDEKKHS